MEIIRDTSNTWMVKGTGNSCAKVLAKYVPVAESEVRREQIEEAIAPVLHEMLNAKREIIPPF